MKIRLRGAKGILAGPRLTWNGCEEIEIDFTGKTGLIALSGENGAGKSSVLECLSHYPQMVSRGGALYNHFMGRAAEKEFESEFMGNTYRSLVKMDCDQSKQEGYMWVNGKPTVNGKISAFSAFCNETFGSPYAYFRSQFSPQKSKATKEMQIENMDRSVFQKLLREFLNLQRYDGWEGTAKQAANYYQGQVAGVYQRIANLQAVTIYRETNEFLYSEAGDKAEMLRADKTLLSYTLDEKRQAVDALKAIIQQNALALARKKDLQGQIDRLEGDLKKEKAEAAKEIDSLSIKYRAGKDQINNTIIVLNDRENIEAAAETVRDLESGLTGLIATIEEMNQNVPVYQKKCHDLETTIAQLRQQVKDLENDPENILLEKATSELDRQHGEKLRELRGLDDSRELFNLDAQIENAKDMTKALDKRGSTCPTPPPADCSFIAGALRAAEILPDLETKRKNLLCTIAINRHMTEEAIEKIKKEAAGILSEKALRIETIKVLTSTIDEQLRTTTHGLRNAQQVLLSTTQLLTAHRKDLTQKREEIGKQKALADRLPEVRIAEERKKDLERHLAEITEAGLQRREGWIVREKFFLSEIQTWSASLAAILIDDVAPSTLIAVLREIIEIENVRIPAVEIEIQIARDQIATLRAELTRIETAEKDLAEVQNERSILVKNMTSWRYLQFATGKTGLQNLRIDGAAPRIVYNANRLLSQAYGALYSIRLETQNEAGKEDLQIKIIMENGQEVYLDDLSGGQRVWNVQALWLAMSLLNQEKSGRKYDYFCADENDGALDAENAEKFTALYRPFMQQAELSQLIYISHKESCRAMADHILTFQHGVNPSWA